jgi:hypothetical protein
MDERRRRIARARERHIVAGVLGGGGDWRGVLRPNGLARCGGVAEEGDFVLGFKA